LRQDNLAAHVVQYSTGVLIKAFLDEYAALCAKHGISIRGEGQHLSEMRGFIGGYSAVRHVGGGYSFRENTRGNRKEGPSAISSDELPEGHNFTEALR
ncbi:hypothetical protein, partial [Sulfitobacter sp.]|uniref:hypothetical protein n=1 Tax=Sulfitobacter sp. TaxID=1903071 RepID=UPI003003A57A